jgi:hypothetical protein
MVEDYIMRDNDKSNWVFGLEWNIGPKWLINCMNNYVDSRDTFTSNLDPATQFQSYSFAKKSIDSYITSDLVFSIKM